jgi:hypothetical protein
MQRGSLRGIWIEIDTGMFNKENLLSCVIGMIIAFASYDVLAAL